MSFNNARSPIHLFNPLQDEQELRERARDEMMLGWVRAQGPNRMRGAGPPGRWRAP